MTALLRTLVAVVFFLGRASGRGPLEERPPSMAWQIAAPVLGIDLFDLDGDGHQELLVARPDGLEFQSLREPHDVLRFWPRGDARALAYCVPRGTGPAPLFLLDEDGRLLRWKSGAAEPEELLRMAGALVPGGVYPLAMARDIDADGRVDLVLPGKQGLLFYLGRDEGFEPGPVVNDLTEVELRIDTPESAEPRVKETVRVPSFLAEDQNGDGFMDLAFRAEDRVRFYWSRPDGSLPPDPTFELDLAAIRDAMPVRERGVLDVSNLFQALDRQVKEDLRDIDGDGDVDLMLREGSKVSVYAGGAAGIDRERATQVLKSSGNLLVAFLADDDGDGKEDLCMLRVQDVSLAEVLGWVVLGGALELELFSYFQEGPLRFARKPSARRSLSLAFPSLLSLVDDMEEPVQRWADNVRRLPLRFDRDGDGERDDLARVDATGKIHVYANVARSGAIRRSSEAALWASVLRRFDAMAAGADELDLNLVDAVEWLPYPGLDRAALLEGVAVSEVLAPRWSGESGAAAIADSTPRLYAFDLDGDRSEELLWMQLRSGSGAVDLCVFPGGRRDGSR